MRNYKGFLVSPGMVEMNVKGKSIREVMFIDYIDARQSKDVGATGRSPLPLARTRKNDIFRINKKEVIIMRKLSKK